MIIYFTGTGNSKYIADMLGDKLEDEITDSREYIRKHSGGSFSSQKPYVFVAPTYGWLVCLRNLYCPRSLREAKKHTL